MSAVQYSIHFRVVGPDGTEAVFNDPTHINYVGVLTNITGLDSPEVIESAENLVGFDGGIHDDFYYGRRPVVLEGLLLNPASGEERNNRMDRLSRATNAMRGDGYLIWEPDGKPTQMISFRRQQPLRFEGGWQKSFQAGLVSADARIYSFDAHSEAIDAVPTSETTNGRRYPRTYVLSYGPGAPNGQLIATNAGTTITYPTIRIEGPALNPTITNVTTGESLYLNYELLPEEYLIVDMLNRTVMLKGTASRYSAVDFLRSDWWGLVPGSNDIRVAFTRFSTGAFLRLDWKDAWV